MYRKYLVAVVCLSALLVNPLWAGDDVKQTLSAIPGDAVGFAYFSNLKQIDADFKSVLQEMGLSEMLMPPMDSLTGMMRMFLMMNEGFNEEGDLIAVFMPPEFIEEMGDRMVMMIPVTDGSALLKAMGGQAGEGGSWKVSLMGNPAVAVVGEKHVILAQDEQTAKAAASSETNIIAKLHEDEIKGLEGLDFALWFDADWLLEQAKPQIDGIVAMFTMMQQAEGSFGAAQADNTKEQVDMLVEGGKSILFGLSLNEHGLGIRCVMRAKPNTKLQKQLKLITTTDSLLKGLPLGKHILAMGGLMHPEAMEKSVENMDVYIKMLGDLQEVDGEKVGALKTLLKERIPLITGCRASLEALPTGPDGLIGFSAIIDAKDSGKMLSFYSELCALCKELVTDAKVKKILDLLTYTKDAETIGDLRVDHLGFDISKLDEIEMDAEENEELLSIIGKEGVLFRLAAVDDKRVV
ncbi:MAG: hypothetical protein KJ645_04420, partial [Planctomycetes bacterium]|nr:hypothetical protein [Planctomycetota bacterium]